ncbi:MAG: BrnT family toxin [Betaproteobacteria bacterium]|nr:BrnT family toxin [Betaproteobacteria bacterium]
MRYTWDENKRQSNLLRHGLDFADAEKVFSAQLVLFEDARRDYGEQRMIAIGQLGFVTVLVMHVESCDAIRIISMLKADSDETDLYYRNVGYF